jgi:hypothetical protein
MKEHWHKVYVDHGLVTAHNAPMKVILLKWLMELPKRAFRTIKRSVHAVFF